MIKDGRLTTNGWLFVVLLFLTFTTPINPFIAHRYLPLVWYAGMGVFGLLLLSLFTPEEERP